jgi:hypothetical protein
VREREREREGEGERERERERTCRHKFSKLSALVHVLSETLKLLLKDSYKYTKNSKDFQFQRQSEKSKFGGNAYCNDFIHMMPADMMQQAYLHKVCFRVTFMYKVNRKSLLLSAFFV